MLFKNAELRAYYQNHVRSMNVMNEGVKMASLEGFAFDEAVDYDVFLSNRFVDRDAVAGLAMLLRDVFGLRVYLDWEDDLDRQNVDKKIATVIRGRLDACRCLMYASSTNAAESKWMPWEVGYMDGKTGRVAICPIVESGDNFVGHEYLSLYPYVSRCNDTKGVDTLWINDAQQVYVCFKDWMAGENPFSH